MLETAVQAGADAVVVGEARLLPVSLDAPGTREVDVEVDVSWQRRGIGTLLLGDVARRTGAEERLVRTRADDQAVMADGALRGHAGPDPGGRRRADRPHPAA